MEERNLPRRCRDCRYSVLVDIGEDSQLLCACVYILRRYQRRPCPPGRGCTAFEPRKEPARE